MKRAFVRLSFLFALAVNGGAAWAALPPTEVPAIEPQATSAQTTDAAPAQPAEGAGASDAVPDDREASFLPSPVDLKTGLPKAPEKKSAAAPAEDSPIKTEMAPMSPERNNGKIDLGAPVSSKILADVDPESVGLLSEQDGGLGASMWAGTPRPLVDALLPQLTLPTASPTLNALARRLLLTTAAVPDPLAGSAKAAKNLTSMRIQKLVALGDVGEAWKMAALVKPEMLDPETTRLLTEAEIIGPDQKEACDKIPAYVDQTKGAPAPAAGTPAASEAVKNPNAPPAPNEVNAQWQKALLACKIAAGDNNAVQLSLDLLREQGVKDDSFLLLVTRNYIAKGKVLPRRLTPMQPLDLAVLHQLSLPLPPEVYARPEAALVQTLLDTKGVDEKARLKLAERMGDSGVVSASDLARVYSSFGLSSEGVVEDKGPAGRASFYQQALLEGTPAKRVSIVLQKFLSDANPSNLTGAIGGVAANLLADVAVISDYNSYAAQGARLMVLAGQTEKAKAWYKLATDVGDRIPDVQKQFVTDWPLYALSGFVPNDAFAKGLKAWLDQALTTGQDVTTPAGEKELQTRRAQAGKVMLFLSAAGLPIAEEAWSRVLGVEPPSRQMTPSPLLLERLHLAAGDGHKAEAALLAILIGSQSEEQAVGVTASLVRALAKAGFDAEAKAYAREAVVRVLYP